MQTAVCAIGRVKEETVKNKTGQHSNNAELQKAPQVACEVYFKLTAPQVAPSVAHMLTLSLAGDWLRKTP
ncbi:MAG: hypothetical protein F6J90_15985 [Moorea sp. SIOASIH]|nr:hypothetical protein [Moorena sp. SIOASIH]